MREWINESINEWNMEEGVNASCVLDWNRKAEMRAFFPRNSHCFGAGLWPIGRVFSTYVLWLKFFRPLYFSVVTFLKKQSMSRQLPLRNWASVANFTPLTSIVISSPLGTSNVGLTIHTHLLLPYQVILGIRLEDVCEGIFKKHHENVR